MSGEIIGKKRETDYNLSGWIYIGLLLGCVLCCLVILKSGLALGAVIACSPFILLAGFYTLKKPIIILFVFYVVNYFIMGVSRYNLISVPITAIIDPILGLLIITVITKGTFYKIPWQLSRNPFTAVSIIWFLYCIVQILNDSVGSINMGDWYTGVRSIAIYPLIAAIIIPLLMNQYKHIQWFLILWAFLSILGAAKGYLQRNRGFDSYELTWLYSHGGTTHLIHSGIRYFSFFTDAGNFGSSMGFTMVTFSIVALYVRNNYLKIYYLIAALAGTYGMIISGTRGALAVPFVGYALLILISKNWKAIVGGILVLIFSMTFLKYTDVGNNNVFVKRMRSVFDTEDASLNVRIMNRDKLSKDMDKLPFGVGIINNKAVSVDNHFYSVISTPPDSWYVTIWTKTGIIGLSLYLCMLAFTIIYGSYLLMFKVKNKELRGILVGMLCGVFGVMVSAYSGDCYTQFPNGPIIYTCQVLIVISPYLDKELTRKNKI